MKKIKLLVALLSIATFSFAQDKELNVSVNGGITIGDIESQSSIAFGADANYLFDWFEDLSVGPFVGVTYFSPKEENEAKLYVPIGAAVRFQMEGDAFYVGTDVGYAIGLSPTGEKGGIYIKPIVGYNISDNFKVNLFYTGVKKQNPAHGFIGLGLTYNIFRGSNGGYYSY